MESSQQLSDKLNSKEHPTQQTTIQNVNEVHLNIENEQSHSPEFFKEERIKSKMQSLSNHLQESPKQNINNEEKSIHNG